MLLCHTLKTTLETTLGETDRLWIAVTVYFERRRLCPHFAFGVLGKSGQAGLQQQGAQGRGSAEGAGRLGQEEGEGGFLLSPDLTSGSTPRCVALPKRGGPAACTVLQTVASGLHVCCS